MTERIARFLDEIRPATPCVVVDLEAVAANYEAMRRNLPNAKIYYAVKANPASEIVSLLVAAGSRFDAASRPEIESCLRCGAKASDISFGNTVKKESDIAWAHAQGVGLFAFDSEEELLKISRAAPGARVFCRLLMTCEGAEWPLSRKFGCEAEMAEELLLSALDLGLSPCGLSFHVGSQQTDLAQWDLAVGRAAEVFARLEARGLSLTLLNLGGGFPIRYRKDVPDGSDCAAAVEAAVARHFGNHPPDLIVEPGRSLVGGAGILSAEVVLVSRKSKEDPIRWVYLDAGKFGGLAETMDESIQYRIETDRSGPDGPVVLAGPTCDSADILYEKAGYEMPLDLRIGDRVRILSAGAYTTSYSAVNFNGFEPLRAYFV